MLNAEAGAQRYGWLEKRQFPHGGGEKGPV